MIKLKEGDKFKAKKHFDEAVSAERSGLFIQALVSYEKAVNYDESNAKYIKARNNCAYTVNGGDE